MLDELDVEVDVVEVEVEVVELIVVELEVVDELDVAAADDWSTWALLPDEPHATRRQSASAAQPLCAWWTNVLTRLLSNRGITMVEGRCD